MHKLSTNIRWTLFFSGGVIVLLSILEHKELLNNYPTLNFIIFPYIWVIGVILMWAGYGFQTEKEKHTGSAEIGSTPGLGKRKSGLFGDGSSWGDGGDGGGGGGD